MRIKIKPLSINEAFKGRRFKTDKHKSYVDFLTLQLPPIKIDFEGQLKIEITFGFSSKGSDIDNGVKPFVDVLQKVYGFNDNQIYEMNLKKEITPKGEEFIEFKIEPIK